MYLDVSEYQYFIILFSLFDSDTSLVHCRSPLCLCIYERYIDFRLYIERYSYILCVLVYTTIAVSYCII